MNNENQKETKNLDQKSNNNEVQPQKQINQQDQEKESNYEQVYLDKWIDLKVFEMIQSKSIPIKQFEIQLYPGQFKSTRIAYQNVFTHDIDLNIISSVDSVVKPTQDHIFVKSQKKEYIRINMMAPKVQCVIDSYIAIVEIQNGIQKVKEVLNFQLNIIENQPAELKYL